MRTSYQVINGTHTFYKLRLADDPQSVVNAARQAAKNDIATAYAKLMRLDFQDKGYAALNDLYSLANTEYYRGNISFNRASLASGSQKLVYFAKAATNYTRSQVHALQVYEALVPAPTSPSDLGLKSFGEDWAVWETETGGK